MWNRRSRVNGRLRDSLHLCIRPLYKLITRLVDDLWIWRWLPYWRNSSLRVDLLSTCIRTCWRLDFSYGEIFSCRSTDCYFTIEPIDVIISLFVMFRCLTSRSFVYPLLSKSLMFQGPVFRIRQRLIVLWLWWIAVDVKLLDSLFARSEQRFLLAVDLDCI